MKLTVVGTGYVGLVTGTCLAEVGNEVLCLDTDVAKIAGLKKGVIPIYEPGLEAMVHENITAGRLSFSTSIEQGVEHGNVIFIAVGTPPDEDGSADLQYVKQVARSIGEYIQDYRVVVTKSTVPVGTSKLVKQTIKDVLTDRNVNVDFSVVSNPEFLKEGAAVEDFMKPDRIVVGVEDEQSLEVLRELYAPFNRNHERLIAMDVQSSELTKYTANALLATKISFMNEMSNLADRLGADIESVRLGIGADPRIGYSFIYPGCGYGGSCFPKDVRALHRTAQSVGYDARILDAVEAVNYDQKRVPVEKIIKHFGSDLKGKAFGLWGLSFKPDTDDMRDAPSRVIIEALWEMGAAVRAFDPAAADEARRIYGEREDLKLFQENPYDAVQDVDCLVIATEWRVFRGSEITKIKALMRGDVIIDGRNIFSPEGVRNSGLTYYGIGRPRLETFHNAKVLVVGDVMLDQYWMGDVRRISPEAPVPVVAVNQTVERIGGAGNVAGNITAMGGSSTLLSIVGNDPAGESLAGIARRAGIHTKLQIDNEIKTTIKLRVISRNQQLLRADFEKTPGRDSVDAMVKQFASLLKDHDVVVLSDYGKGSLTTVDQLIEQSIKLDKPVLVDPKGSNFSRYRGATLITPNLGEFEAVVGEVNSAADMENKALDAIREYDLQQMLVTQSEKGMTLFDGKAPGVHIPARSREVYDVSGAGDTVIAMMAMARSVGMAAQNALEIANSAAGVVISKLGTATPTPEEVSAALKRDYPA